VFRSRATRFAGRTHGAHERTGGRVGVTHDLETHVDTRALRSREGTTIGKRTSRTYLTGGGRLPRDAGSSNVMAGRLETRDRLEQRARVRVLRSRAYLIDRPGFDHVAAVHHGDTLTGLGNDTEIVRHEQDCHVEITTALLDQLEDLRLGRHVERRSRFVGDQESRTGRDRDGDHDALAHAAGEFVREGTIALLWSVNLNAREQFNRARARGGLIHSRVHAQVSATCSPIRLVGLKQLNGSWKIMPTLWAR